MEATYVQQIDHMHYIFHRLRWFGRDIHHLHHNVMPGNIRWLPQLFGA
jgi:hypothetical protein